MYRVSTFDEVQFIYFFLWLFMLSVLYLRIYHEVQSHDYLCLCFLLRVLWFYLLYLGHWSVCFIFDSFPFYTFNFPLLYCDFLLWCSDHTDWTYYHVKGVNFLLCHSDKVLNLSVLQIPYLKMGIVPFSLDCVGN